MLRRQFACEMIGLRGAGNGRKRRRNLSQHAALAEFCDARRMFADERFSQPDDVDDGEPVHQALARMIR